MVNEYCSPYFNPHGALRLSGLVFEISEVNFRTAVSISESRGPISFGYTDTVTARYGKTALAAWTGLTHTPQVLKSAKDWRRKCLLGDESLFTEENLWTLERVAELKELFVGNPIAGKQRFYDKLKVQIGGAESQVIQLASEALWLLLLMVYERTMKSTTKRDRILEVWALSGTSTPTSPHLEEDVLRGMVNPGRGFMTLWTEYGFLLTLLAAWKKLSPSEQRRLLLKHPWALGDWVSGVEDADSRSFRHMFLYLCYPDEYEKITSSAAKKQVYAVFSGLIADGDDSYKNTPSLLTLDQSIYQIRQTLQQEHGTEELDFYQEPLMPLWQEPNPKPKSKKVNPSKSDKIIRGKEFNLEAVVEELFLEFEEVQHILSLWRRKKNLILQGPPGVGKTFAARKLAYALMEAEAPDCVEFIQFHQSYSYEDFIQGYRPVKDRFELQNGSFHDFCRKAQSNPEMKHAFIIDEINRANLSKVFGETMMLIEADKRGEKWRIQLAYDQKDEKFFVPDNLHLLGLMNTADRSLAVVDYALRRRFGFFELKPRFGSRKFRDHVLGMGVSEVRLSNIEEMIGSLNEAISEDQSNLGRGYCIGHSYFCAPMDESLSEREWYEQIIRTEVLPLLEEYWFDAPLKVDKWRETLLSGS